MKKDSKASKRFFTKKKICFIAALLVIISVSMAFFISCGGDDDPPVDPPVTQDSTMLKTPTDGTNPGDYDAKTNAYYAIYTMNELDSFTTESNGQTSTKALVTVNQKIKGSRVINNGEVYKQNVSHSSFKSVGATTFVKGDNYVIHNAKKVSSVDEVKWEDTAISVSKDTFINKFGYVPNNMTSYVLTDETIISAEFLGEENGIYSFIYNLDTEKSTTNLRLEMRTMAGNDSLPEFEKASIIVRMNKDWLVTEVTTNSVYQVDMLGGVTCTESVTEVFSNFNKGVQIPNVEFYRSYLDAEITDPEPVVLTATDYLMAGFEPYITGTPLKISATASATDLSVNLDAVVNLNTEELAKTTASIKVNSLAYQDIALENVLAYYENDNIYLNAEGVKVVTSINEITNFINKNSALSNLIDLSSLTNLDLGSMDLESLFENATLVDGTDTATVTLPLTLGDITVNATMLFTTGEIAVKEVTATIGEVNLCLTVDNQVSVEEKGDGYNAITPLLSILENNEINLKANALGLEVDVNVNIESGIVLAKTTIYGEPLYAKIADGKAYISYKGLNGYVELESAQVVLDKLAGLGIEINLPDFSSIKVEDILNSIVITDSEDLTISVEILGYPITATLDKENGLALSSITATIEGEEIAVTLAEKAEYIDFTANYYNLITLLDVIDENNKISLKAELNETIAYLTIDLIKMEVLVSLDELEVLVDLTESVAYARYPGVNLKFNFNELDYILTELEPIITKFISKEEYDSIDLDVLSNINVEEIISSIVVTETEDALNLALSIKGTNVNLTLDKLASGLSIGSGTINMDAINLAFETGATPLDITFDKTAEYISANELVKTFAKAVANVLTLDNLYANMTATIVSGNTTIELTECEVLIADIYAATKARGNLSLKITTTNEDNSTSVSEHKIALFYLDPTLVGEGQVNTYFTYDNTADTNVFAGTFTTVNFYETLDIIKGIYLNMPELQEALEPFIVKDENGNPTFMELDVDFKNLINSSSFVDGVLTVDANAKTVLSDLSDSVVLNLSSTNDLLGVNIKEVDLKDSLISLNATVGEAPEGIITPDKFEFTPLETASDFSSINELLLSLKTTAEKQHFYIDSKVNIQGSGLLSWLKLNDKISMKVYLDIIDGKTYFTGSVTRKDLGTLVGLVMDVWSDYDGVSYLYFDPDTQIIYVHNHYRTKTGGFLGIGGTIKEHDEYLKYTMDEFMADPINIIFEILHISDSLVNTIMGESSSNDTTTTSTATIENTFTKYSYDASNSTFNINLDLTALTKDIKATTVAIKHDANYNLTNLDVSVGMMDIINLKLSATLQTSDTSYGSLEAIQEQANSGNYN